MIRPAPCQHHRFVSTAAVLFVAALTLILPANLTGQVAGPAEQAAATLVPEASLLRNLALAMRKADELDKSGGRRASLGRSFCGRLGLETGDCAVVLQTTADLDANLLRLDSQARKIIEDVRAKHRRAPGSLIPPPPPELGELQAQRDALVSSAVATMKQRLTGAGKQTLSSYVAGRSGRITPSAVAQVPAAAR